MSIKSGSGSATSSGRLSMTTSDAGGTGVSGGVTLNSGTPYCIVQIVPRMRRRRLLLRFVFGCLTAITLSSSLSAGNISGDTSNALRSPGSALPSSTRVLIVRPVSPSETTTVAGDVAYVKSFYSGRRHVSLLERSMSRCDELMNSTKDDASGISGGGNNFLSPYELGDAFPNHLLCISRNDRARRGGRRMENNFLAVEADFMLFARSRDHAAELSAKIDEATAAVPLDTLNGTITSRSRHDQLLRHEVDVNIIDVSANPRKVYNWVHHAIPARLDGYDYVWFIDGDIVLMSLNWQAYFHQVNVMRPKICSASIIGESPEKKAGTYWTTLRYQSDPRLLAGEVTISELGYTMLEVSTWLRYREILVNETEVMRNISLGGENCFDMGWCHLAKNDMVGRQERGPILDRDIEYVASHGENSSHVMEVNDSTEGAIRGRSCVVFYQTPLQHVNKKSFVHDDAQIEASKGLCQFFRGQKGVIGAGGLWTVHQLFVAPKEGPAMKNDK